MRIEADEKLERIAVELPGSIPVFEHHKIDLDAVAEATLETACRKAGAPLREVLEELRALVRRDDGARDDWDHAPLPALVHFIMDHHHRFEQRLVGHIHDLFERNVERHGSERAEFRSLKTLFSRMSSGFLSHMKREEKDLFVHFRHEVAPGAGETAREELAHRSLPLVLILEKEHRGLENEWAGIRALVRSLTLPPEASLTWRALYQALDRLEQYQKEHVHKEEDVLFKRIKGMSS